MKISKELLENIPYIAIVVITGLFLFVYEILPNL